MRVQTTRFSPFGVILACQKPTRRMRRVEKPREGDYAHIHIFIHGTLARERVPRQWHHLRATFPHRARPRLTDIAQFQTTGVFLMRAGVTSGHVILIVDANRLRISRIEALLAELNLTPVLQRTPTRIHEPSFALALVAVSDPPTNARELEAIRALHEAGMSIIAYGDEIHRWEISARCLPLLAGATHFLESIAE